MTGELAFALIAIGFILCRLLSHLSKMFFVPVQVIHFDFRASETDTHQFRIRLIGRARVDSIEAEMPDGRVIKVDDE